jgi:xylulokinase
MGRAASGNLAAACRYCNKKMFAKKTLKTYEILGIGISCQMHGLVMVDKNYEIPYPPIIWCDSRAVKIGNKAYSIWE